MQIKNKLKMLAAMAIVGVSASSYAVWKNAQTVVYYTDASMTQVSGYVMYYCQTTARKLVGTSTSYSKVLDGGSCDEGGIPPMPY